MKFEAGGWVAECDCGWLMFESARAAAERVEDVHQSKCNGPKQVTTAAPKRATKATWDNREGSTWIDQM